MMVLDLRNIEEVQMWLIEEDEIQGNKMVSKQKWTKQIIKLFSTKTKFHSDFLVFLEHILHYIHPKWCFIHLCYPHTLYTSYLQ